MDEDKMLKLLNNADPEAVARAMQNTTMQEMADSAARSLALEQLDENKKQIKLKIKPKKDKKTIRPDKGGKGNYKFTVTSDKGGKGNYTPKGIRKMPPISREMAKGGEVKGYMGGGSVHKNKKNMITTKGWGASRKT
jgi:hypothetical protein